MTGAIRVGGIWLQGFNGAVKVLAQVEGVWVVVIHEKNVALSPVSHIVEPSGIA